MDDARFDRLARTLAGLTTRRGLFGLPASLPILGGGLALLGLEDAETKERRKNKHKKGRKNDQRQRDVSDEKKRKKKKHKKKKCKPQSITTTCEGTCGQVKNNCNKTVDCGSCECEPACDACETCFNGQVCVPCDTCCDDVCCPHENAVCHAGTGACCGPGPKSTTCNQQCGDVVNNCGITVDCGDCTCPGGCAECLVCDGDSGTCVGDAEQQGEPCGAAASCAGGEVTPRGRCNGSGACNPSPTVSCAPYTRCADNACATTCGDDNDCVNGHFCDEDDHCIANRFNSKPCDRDRQCQSGFCVDGVCCASASCPECQACNLNGHGTCAAVADGAACGSGDVCCSGSCEECCNSGQCSGANPICVSNTCQPCTAGPGSCPGDSCCDANSGECVATCPTSETICDVDNVCKPACQSNANCGQNAICVDGQCQSCHVLNGENLWSAIHVTSPGGTLYVCPGSYPGDFAGDFFINEPITIIGAGDGGNGTVLGGRVYTMAGSAAQPVTLRGLRISGPGQGVRLEFGYLEMADCTVTNSPVGVYNLIGTLEMQRCQVVDNGNGGGIANLGGPMTLRDCQVEGNGGTGISNNGDNPTPGITVSLDLYDTEVTGNMGGGIANVNGASVTLHGDSLVCGNTPAGSQCTGFSDPEACLDTCPGG